MAAASQVILIFIQHNGLKSIVLFFKDTRSKNNVSNFLMFILSSLVHSGLQRISVFEPYPMRDTVQHFCEKHLDKIKAYMENVSVRIPPPAKCTIEGNRVKLCECFKMSQFILCLSFVSDCNNFLCEQREEPKR